MADIIQMAVYSPVAVADTAPLRRMLILFRIRYIRRLLELVDMDRTRIIIMDILRMAVIHHSLAYLLKVDTQE